MGFLDTFNLEQLNRLLTVCKWLLAILGVTFICAWLFHHWLAGRISTLQQRDADQRIKASQTELEVAHSKSAELTAELAKFTAPRKLTAEQIAALRKCLTNGPRGKVVMAWLKVENDAQSYAEEIAQLLTETGFEISTTKTVWLQLAVKGIYLCARDAS